MSATAVVADDGRCSITDTRVADDMELCCVTLFSRSRSRCRFRYSRCRWRWLFRPFSVRWYFRPARRTDSRLAALEHAFEQYR